MRSKCAIRPGILLYPVIAGSDSARYFPFKALSMRSRESPFQPAARIVALMLALFCSTSSRADTLSIGVAANLQFVFGALQAAFEKQTGHRLQPSFNSSGRLATQIQLGAPLDLFLSADMAFPEQLHQSGQTAGAPAVYAKGILVLWTRKPLDLAHWQRSLASADVKRIALASPTAAPYGREALRALTFYQLQASLQPKLVFAESISQVNQYVDSQAVDAGFTAKSVVVSAAMQGKGRWIEVPAEAYQPIAQGMVITRHGDRHHREAVRQLHAFLLSAPARAIFASDGYQLP